MPERRRRASKVTSGNFRNCGDDKRRNDRRHIMTTLQHAQPEVHKPHLERSGVNRILQVLFSIVLMGVVLFLTAGRIDWPAAWMFLGTYTLVILTAGVWAARKHPDVINERGKIAHGAKAWDKVLMTIYTVMLIALFAVAGLDAGRYGWSTMPLAAQIVGSVAFLLATLVTYWAMAANPFLATIVRIQADRGHYVVTTGPYRYVRHPMYAMMFLMWPGIALALGSWWALIPAAVIIVVFVIRTVLEDQTLQAGLPGYAAYAQHTRYRLIPGVW
jgi:protein-S-isoprenylcysteine O-methyltransferase Ste14